MLSHPSPRAVTVHVSTVDGTAIEGDDYRALTNYRVTIPANTPIWPPVPVTVTLINDDITEEPDEETFGLRLSNPTNGVLHATFTEAEATIVDDDIPTVPGAVQNLTMDCSTVGVTGEVTITWEPGPGTPPDRFQVVVYYPSHDYSTNPFAFSVGIGRQRRPVTHLHRHTRRLGHLQSRSHGVYSWFPRWSCLTRHRDRGLPAPATGGVAVGFTRNRGRRLHHAGDNHRIA